MIVSDEDLSAFADNELEGDRKAEVAAAIAADPELARTVEQHRALRARLGVHFSPIAEQEVPTRLTDMLQTRDRVVDLSAARQRKTVRASGIRWGWFAAPALAASLALAVFLPRSGETPEGYAPPDLSEVLDTQVAATGGQDVETRILLSFQRKNGQFCRAFSSGESSGIACRDNTGWALVEEADGTSSAGSEFRQAGSSLADLLEQAQQMANGPALNAEAERAAMETDWVFD